MRLTAEMRYAAEVEAVYLMLLDPEFQQRKCRANGSVEQKVQVNATADGGAVVISQQVLPTSRVPDFVRSFVGPTLKITQTEQWAAAEPGTGVRRGTVVVAIEGAPVRFTGSLLLAAVSGGTGSVETIDGELKASVPLLGGKIEKAAEPAIRAAIAAEQRTGTDWLTGTGRR